MIKTFIWRILIGIFGATAFFNISNKESLFYNADCDKTNTFFLPSSLSLEIAKMVATMECTMQQSRMTMVSLGLSSWQKIKMAR